MIWRSLNIISYLSGVLVGIFFLLRGIAKYKSYKFKPYLILALGMSIIGSSFIFDLSARFLGPDQENIVLIYLEISNLLFLLGSILTMCNLLIVRSSVPWFRLVIYALFYGMTMKIYIDGGYYVEYNSTIEMWFIYYFNSDLERIFFILISLPIFDTMIYVLLRQRYGFSSNSARIAVLLFWIGMISPTIFMVLSIPDEIINFTLSNVAFNIGYMSISLAFLLEPLLFTLNKTRYYEITIASPEEGDIAIAQYAWVQNENQDLKSHALSAIDTILNEMVRENPEDLVYVRQIDLGKKKVIIERSEHLVGYIVANESDITVGFGLRRVLHTLERKWQKNIRQSNTTIKQEEFKTILRDSFTFATAANKII